MSLIFCDRNQKLIELVFREDLPLTMAKGDIFRAAEDYAAVIATASNPSFTMGGGLDLQITKKFPDEVVNLWHGKITKHLLGIVSVNDQLEATDEIIRFALQTIVRASKNQNIVFTGIGTGIGGMSEAKFVEILSEVIN